MSNKIENLDTISEIKNLEFCVFDLETTGGNQKSDKIIEIGMVKIINLKIVEEKTYMINPEIRIPEFIQKLTSISQKNVAGCPTIEEVLEDILSFLGDSVLVAHNASFDVPFLNSVLKRMGKKELTNRSICTNLMTKYLIPNLMNSNLNYMSKIFDIGHKRAHRALDDALATANLLLIFLNVFIEKDIQKINHLYYPKNRYELDRIHFKDDTPKSKILKIIQSKSSCMIATFKGENGVILFAMPISGHPEEIEMMGQKISDLSWKILTVQLVGPYTEALISINQVFAKIDLTFRNELIRLMWNVHFPGGHKIPALVIDEEYGDFIIIPHLVPEQLTIYPIQGLHLKSRLVFRYPGHQKKLLQYINSKSSKISGNKIKKAHFHPMLKDFLDSYLHMEKSKGDLFVFHRKMVQKGPEDFFSALDSFLLKKPNSYHYPKNHI